MAFETDNLSEERRQLRIDVKCVGNGEEGAGCGYRGGVGGDTCPQCGGMLLSKGGRDLADQLIERLRKEPDPPDVS